MEQYQVQRAQKKGKWLILCFLHPLGNNILEVPSELIFRGSERAG